MTHHLIQIVIGLTGAAAILLISRDDHRWIRWGYVIGLAGQPFWLWSSWQGGQWGMFALALVYAAVWAGGVRASFGRNGR